MLDSRLGGERYSQRERRQRLEAFLPLLCETAARESDPDRCTEHGQSALCAGRLPPQCLSRLTTGKPCARLGHLLSPWLRPALWVADRLAARPELVDELLHEARRFISAPSRDELHALVTAAAAPHSGGRSWKAQMSALKPHQGRGRIAGRRQRAIGHAADHEGE